MIRDRLRLRGERAVERDASSGGIFEASIWCLFDADDSSISGDSELGMEFLSF
ncbi:hypothetical protein ACSSVY_002275 [Roseovarius sp. MBR-51]